MYYRRHLTLSFVAFMGPTILLALPVRAAQASPAASPVIASKSQGSTSATVTSLEPPQPTNKINLGAEFQPLPSGNGILIADPVADDRSTAAFGAGCTRWLFNVVGSSFELGKTTGWGGIDTYLRLSGSPNWQLTPENTRQVQQYTGVTHIALSRMSGRWRAADVQNPATPLTLEIQLRDAKSGQEVGEPIRLSGTPEDILKALPAAATQLLIRLGIEKPSEPAAITDTAEDFCVVGQVPLRLSAKLDPNLKRQLRGLADKSPWLQAWSVRASRTMRQTPTIAQPTTQINFPILMFEQICRFDPELGQRWRFSLGPISHAQPNNHLVAEIESDLAEVAGDKTGLDSARTRALRCSLGSGQDWLKIANQYAEAADALRNARPADGISEAEWKKLEALYFRWEAAANRAARLMETSSEAWTQLAEAATFAADGQVATAALRKAEQCDANDSKIYSWGVQMFQPKWLDNPDEMVRLATLASQAGRPQTVLRQVPEMLQYIPGPEPKTSLMEHSFTDLFTTSDGYFGNINDWKKEAEALSKAAFAAPQDGSKWVVWGDFLGSVSSKVRLGRPYSGLSASESQLLMTLNIFSNFAYSKQLELNPRDAETLGKWSELLFAQGDSEEAIAAITKAVKLKPNDITLAGTAANYAAPKWVSDGEFISWANANIVLNPTFLARYAPLVVSNLQSVVDGGGELGRAQSTLDKANEYINKTDLATADPIFIRFLLRAASFSGDQKRAMEIGQKWVTKEPDNAEAHYQLASVLDRSRLYQAAAEEYRAVLKVNPKHAPALLYLGMILVRSKNWDGAETYLTQARQLVPFWTQTRLQLGWVYAAQGKFEDALDEVESVIADGEAVKGRNPQFRLASQERTSIDYQYATNLSAKRN